MKAANQKTPLSVSFIVSSLIATLVIFAIATIGVIGIEHMVITAIGYGWPLFFNIILPAVTVGLALCVITLQNLVHSLLCLIGVFMTTVLLYLGAGAEYLAFVFTVVYVGAVSILFLFVIMLINIRNVAAPYSLLPASRKLLMVVTFGLTALLVIRFSQMLDTFIFTSDCLQFAAEPTTVETLINFVTTQFLDILIFSERLYTDFSYLFFLIALLLLTAMLGAIILATGATDSAETTA